MAPRQRTFTIVPNPLGMQGLVQRPAGEAPKPMTSKQAQKLHRQATRLPKRTKAEQIQYEREQQKLIKEEDEKRRASNKARMLRERKKEKEQTLIESKKRKGLPLVDVRPSQDLITRFVRGNGSGIKRDASGAPVRLDTVREESPSCDPATETAADEDIDVPSDGEAETSDRSVEALEPLPEPSSMPAKRLRTGLSTVGTHRPRPDQSPRPSPRASRTAVSALRMLDARSRESSLDVDDPAVEELLRTQILEETISAANSSAIQQLSPVPKIPSEKENIPPASRGLVDKSSPKLAQAQPRIQRRSPAVKMHMPPPPPPSSCLNRRASDLPTPAHRPSPAYIDHRLARDLGITATESVLPSSTQMFLLSNLDDILPSPSQELRELEETTPSRPATSGPQPPIWKPMPSFTSHEPRMLRRPTSRHPLTVPPPRWAPRLIQPASGAPSKMQVQRTVEPALPLYSTQDLLLSSQDIRDLQETTETPSRPAKLPLQPLEYPSRARQTGQAVSEVATQRSPPAQESEDRSSFPHASLSGLRKSQTRTPLYSSPKAFPSPEPPKPSASPRQRRFFTASNEAVQLAMEKSMRTHKEEQRRREAEQRALQLLRREEQEDVDDSATDEDERAEEHEGQEDAEETLCNAREQQENYLLDELADDVEAEMQELLRFEERDAKEDVQRDIFELDDDIAEELLAAEYDLVRDSSRPLLPMGHGPTTPAEESRVCAASQETDYGDLDVSFEDLDEYF